MLGIHPLGCSRNFDEITESRAWSDASFYTAEILGDGQAYCLTYPFLKVGFSNILDLI